MERMRLLRAQAKEKNEVIREDPNYPTLEFKHEGLGYNFRMMNLQAAIGLGQLERLDDVVAQKQHIAEVYRGALESLGLSVQEDAGNVYMVVGVLFRDREQQNDVAKYLQVKGVDTRSFFYPMHLHTHLSDFCTTLPGRENVSEDLNERGLVLPNDITIADDEIRQIAEYIKECL